MTARRPPARRSPPPSPWLPMLICAMALQVLHAVAAEPDCAAAAAAQPLGNTAFDAADRLAETLWAAIQQLGLDEVAVCGIHTDATISVELASRQRPGPRIVGAVVSGVTLMPDDAKAWLSTLAERDEREGEISMAQQEAPILQSWQDRSRRWLRAPMALLVQSLADELAAFPNLNDGFKAIRDHDMAAAIARVDVPVLVLNGEHDSMAKIDAAAAPLFRNAKQEVPPGWGGQLHGSASLLYAERLLNFLLPKFSH